MKKKTDQDFEQHIQKLLNASKGKHKTSQETVLSHVSQSIKDAQKGYEEDVARQRGIPGIQKEVDGSLDYEEKVSNPTSLEMNPAERKTFFRYPDGNEDLFRHEDHMAGKPAITENFSTNAVRSYQGETERSEETKKQRTEKCSTYQSNHYSETEPATHQDTTRTQRTREDIQTPEGITGIVYDYTKRQPVQDAQRGYEEEVNSKRQMQRTDFQKSMPNTSGSEEKDVWERRSYRSAPEKEEIPSISPSAQNSSYCENPSRRSEADQLDKQTEIDKKWSSMVSGDSILNRLHTSEKIPESEYPYDYTKSKPIQDAQKDYQRRIIEENKNWGNAPVHRKEHDTLAQYGDIPPGSDLIWQNEFENGNKTDKGTVPLYVSRINLERGVSPEELTRGKIDLSELYERSSRGGEANTDFTRTVGASEEDLKNLLECRNLKPSSGKRYRIAGQIQKTTSMVGTYLYESTSSGTDFGQGTRYTKSMTGVAVGLICNRAYTSMVNSMRKELANRLNKKAEKGLVFGNNKIYIANPELGITKDELELLEKELDALLVKDGLPRLKGSYVQQQNIINTFLKKNKEKLTASEIAALNMRKDIAKIKTLDQSKAQRRRQVFRKLQMKAMRYIQQADAGQGAVFTYNLIRRTSQTLQSGMRMTMMALKVAAISGKLAMRTAAKAAAALAKTRLADKLAQTKPAQAAKSAAQSVRSGSAKIAKKRASLESRYKKSRIGKMMAAFQERHARFKKFTNDPFALKRRRKELLGKLKKSKAVKPVVAVFKPINIVKSMLGYLLSGLMAIASTMMTVFMIMCFLFLIIAILVCVVAGIITAIIGLFDFSNNEDEIKQAAFDTIKQCYETQNQQIADMNDGRYRNFTIQYETVKDFDAYNQEDHKPEESFVETTNSAEMLCMATVYFDFDLEEAGKEKVVDYIEKLYNGSHLLSVVETPYIYTDEDGEEHTVIDASATLTTYYFNALFECSLTSSSGGILAGTEVSEQVWNYFRSLGFSEQSTAAIMGNMYQESGMDPTRIQNGGGPAAGICQWENYSTKSKRWANLNRLAESRGKQWTDLQVQLDYLMWELQGGDTTCQSIMNNNYGGLENFKRSTDIAWAVEAFERSFERAGKPNMSRRITQANAYYNMYKGREVQTENPEESE